MRPKIYFRLAFQVFILYCCFRLLQLLLKEVSENLTFSLISDMINKNYI